MVVAAHFIEDASDGYLCLQHRYPSMLFGIQARRKELYVVYAKNFVCFSSLHSLLMIFEARNQLCRFRILTVLRTLMANRKCDPTFSELRRAVWSHTKPGPSGPTQTRVRLVPHRPHRLVPHRRWTVWSQHRPLWSNTDPSGPSQTRLVPHRPGSVWSHTDPSGPTQTLD